MTLTKSLLQNLSALLKKIFWNLLTKIEKKSQMRRLADIHLSQKKQASQPLLFLSVSLRLDLRSPVFGMRNLTPVETLMMLQSLIKT